MSLHTWCLQCPRKPSSCATFTLNPHWGRAATGQKKKKDLVSMCTGWSPTLVVSDSLQPCGCGLPGICARERVLQARILKYIGQYWLPYSSRALYFLQLPTPLSTWCYRTPVTQAAAPPPSLGQTQFSRAASGANPSGRPTCRGGNKSTFETQRQCG